MNPKSEPDSPLEAAIREMATVMRRHRLDYNQTVYVAGQARQRVGITQQAPARRLPRNLTEAQREAFFAAVQRGGIPAHDLLFRLLYATGLRVAEMTAMRRDAVDMDTSTMRVNAGKGNRDRVVLFPEGLRLPLRLYLDSI